MRLHYALACVFNTYVFQLALEVSKVITEAPVLRQQLSVLSILGTQSRLNFPPLAQRICQITLLLLVPERGEQSEELCTIEENVASFLSYQVKLHSNICTFKAALVTDLLGLF